MTIQTSLSSLLPCGAVSCSLEFRALTNVSKGRGETQLLLVKGNVLELYEVSTTCDKLFLHSREVLSSKIIDAKVSPSLDNLFLMFTSGNVSILRFDEQLGEFITLSLHDWSNPPLQTHSSHTLGSLCSEVQLGDPIDDLSLHGAPSHLPIDLMALEPVLGRIACVRRGQKHLAFLPRPQKHSFNGNRLQQSHLMPVSAIDIRIRNVVRFTFLPTYQRPTLAILYEANETFPFAMGAGHPAPQDPTSIPRRRMDTLCLMVVSITKFFGIDDDDGHIANAHIGGSRIKGGADTTPIRFTTIHHFEGLPTGARGMVSINNKSNRGILLNGANELLYLDLQAKGGLPLLNYLPLNTYAPLTSRIAKGSGGGGASASLRKSLIVQTMSTKFQTSMERCSVLVCNPSPSSASPDLLLSSDDGNFYSLWLDRGGGGSGGVSSGGKIVLLPSQKGSCPSISSSSDVHLLLKGAPILHVTALTSLQRGKEFHWIQPVVGDSVLVKRNVSADGSSSMDVAGAGARNDKNSSAMDVDINNDDDDDDPYAIDQLITVAARTTASSSLTKTGQVEEGDFEIHSVVKNHGPVNDMVPTPDGTGIAVCGGYGRMATLTMYHSTTVKLHLEPLSVDGEAKKAKRIFSVANSLIGSDSESTFTLNGPPLSALGIPVKDKRSVWFSSVFGSSVLQVTPTSVHLDSEMLALFKDDDRNNDNINNDNGAVITKVLLSSLKDAGVHHMLTIDSAGFVREFVISKIDGIVALQKPSDSKEFFNVTMMDDVGWACGVDKTSSFVAWPLGTGVDGCMIVIDSWAMTLPIVGKEDKGGNVGVDERSIAEICGSISRSLIVLESLSFDVDNTINTNTNTTITTNTTTTKPNEALLVVSIAALPYPLLFRFSPSTGLLRKWKTSSWLSSMKDCSNSTSESLGTTQSSQTTTQAAAAAALQVRAKKVCKTMIANQLVLLLLDWYPQKEQYYSGMLLCLGKQGQPRLHSITVSCPKTTKIQHITSESPYLLLGNGRIWKIGLPHQMDLDYYLPFTEKIIYEGYWMKSIEYHSGSFALTSIADDHLLAGEDGATFTMKEDEYSVISDNQNFSLPANHLKTSQGKYFISLFSFDLKLGWMCQDRHLYPDEELDALWVRTLQPPPVISAPGSGGAPMKSNEPEKASAQEKALRFRLASSEAITCMSSVPLETRSVREGQKPFLCIGTSLIRGEDRPCRGYVLVLEVVEVVPPPDEPWRTKRFKPICLTDMKGPVTELSSIQGGGGLQPYLLTGLGPKALISNLEADEALEGVAFVDVGICVTGLAGSLKGFFASGDVVRGLCLWAFQEKPPKILSLARDDDSLHGDLWNVDRVEAITTPTAPKGNVELGLLAVGPEGSLRYLQYVPGASQVIGGARLIPGGSLQLTSSVKRMRRISSTTTHGRQGNLVLQTDGTILKIMPIGEDVGDGVVSGGRLSLLQRTLFSAIRPPAGLHPVGGRSVINRRSLSDSTNVLEGNLGWIDMTSTGLLKLFDLPLPAIRSLLCMSGDKFDTCLAIIDGMIRKSFE